MAIHNGMPMTKNITPANAAPQRQPQVKTMALNSGAMSTPPRLNAALLMVMARARWRMNQLLTNTIGACMKPPA